MNKQETAEAILVMQAWIDGAEVEYQAGDDANWYSVEDRPQWEWDSRPYRIKPSPREFWITIEPPGETLVAWSQKPLPSSKGKVIKVREVL